MSSRDRKLLSTASRILPTTCSWSDTAIIIMYIVPEAKRTTSRLGRYVLADNYLCFYFRFIRRHVGLLEQELHDRLWDLIGEELRAFIGATASGDLSREWVLAKARAGRLPFLPEGVGSHWGKGVQVDVAAVNWREHTILLGECRWGTEAVGRSRCWSPVQVEGQLTALLFTFPWGQFHVASGDEHSEKRPSLIGGPGLFYLRTMQDTSPGASLHLRPKGATISLHRSDWIDGWPRA